jgi:hypothetical protein
MLERGDMRENDGRGNLTKMYITTYVNVTRYPSIQLLYANFKKETITVLTI